jgi:hypothetical protein
MNSHYIRFLTRCFRNSCRTQMHKRLHKHVLPPVLNVLRLLSVHIWDWNFSEYSLLKYSIFMIGRFFADLCENDLDLSFQMKVTMTLKLSSDFIIPA